MAKIKNYSILWITQVCKGIIKHINPFCGCLLKEKIKKKKKKLAICLRWDTPYVISTTVLETTFNFALIQKSGETCILCPWNENIRWNQKWRALMMSMFSRMVKKCPELADHTFLNQISIKPFSIEHIERNQFCRRAVKPVAKTCDLLSRTLAFWRNCTQGSSRCPWKTLWEDLKCNVGFYWFSNRFGQGCRKLTRTAYAMDGWFQFRASASRWPIEKKYKKVLKMSVIRALWNAICSSFIRSTSETNCLRDSWSS